MEHHVQRVCWANDYDCPKEHGARSTKSSCECDEYRSISCPWTIIPFLSIIELFLPIDSLFEPKLMILYKAKNTQVPRINRSTIIMYASIWILFDLFLFLYTLCSLYMYSRSWTFHSNRNYVYIDIYI